MITCQHCANQQPAGSAVCAACGQRLAAWPYLAGTPLAEELGLERLTAHADLLAELPALQSSACPHCGGQNRAGALYCLHCGHSLVGGNGATPAPASYPGPGALARGGPGSLPAGRILRERYRIIGKVAQGGMGAVYEVADLQEPGTRLAIKEMTQAVLRPDERTQALRDFMREATILATLQHPNLPAFHGFFAENGKHYMVMEFIAGRTLEAVLAAGRPYLSERRVLAWAAQLCDVLAYLHAQDPPIIYRDCKPGNIMLLDGSERVKLIDFGIARFHRSGRPAEDAAYGTAGYAPPEQYGNGQTDQRSDIYALAATLHHLLTGHDPGEKPFHWRSARTYNPRVSPPVDRALLRALELDPALRYPDVYAFRQALGLPLATPTENLERITSTAPTKSAPAASAQPATPVTDQGSRSTDHEKAILQLSETKVDLGQSGRRARQGRLVTLHNAGEGALEGRVRANQPWIALNVRQVSPAQIDVTVATRPERLDAGRLRWPVPNLLLMAGRALRRMPILVILLLAALVMGLAEPPVGRLLLLAGLLLGVAGAAAQFWLALVAWQVALFVPAPLLHQGQVLVETNGGNGRFEVQVQARPGLLRRAGGWLLVSVLLLGELLALGWAILALGFV